MNFKPIRNLLGRLRGTVGNRRRAPRYDARIHFSVSLLDEGAARDGAPPPPPRTPLVGHTRNLSETGLGLIVPSLRFGASRLDKEDVTLRLMLDLPKGTVEIHVAPVRSFMLGADDKETGYFIGVQITQLSDDARARLVKYLRGLRAPR